LGAGIAGYAPVIAKQGGSFKPTSASSRRTSEVQNADIGKIQNGRFIPTAYTAKADKNAIVTSMLVSSGYDPSKIEEKDIRDYENFLINANGLKSRDELWSGKGFKVPPRVIGQNEMDIISKLTPELQKQYATLVEQKEKALKAGNNGGAAKAQERMNQIATKGGVPRSPYTISDEQYNRFGAIFGVGTKEEVDATLMQLAQMDSGAMDAALNQAKIDEASSQIILNGVKTKQAKMEMEAIQQQLENGGLTPKDALEYQIKLTELNTKQFNLQQAPIEALAKSEKAVVDLYNSTTGKKPQTDRDKITWVNQMVKTNNPIINQYKQNYLFNLEQNAYGLIPKEGEDEASFKIRIARARETARENMDSLIVDQLSTSLGLTPEKERTLWDKLTNRSGGRTGATASDLNRIPPKDQVVRGSSESDIANKVIQRNKGAR
jgi:hypothetical protein